MELRFQKRALNDLERLVRRIAQDDPAAAQRFGFGLVAAAERRCLAPLSGRPYDPARGIYSFPFPPYRVYYRVRARRQTMEILKIWHGFRGRRPTL